MISMIHPVYKIMCYLFKSAFYELFDGGIYGMENVPIDGPIIIACNHCSYFDPPFLGAAVDSREIFSFAKKNLFSSKFGSWLFANLDSIPVDRDNTDITAIKAVLKLLRNGKGIMIFPEGTRSCNGELNKAHPGVGLFACKSGVPVVPCRVFGTFEIMNRFSHLPNWNKRASIVFGKPMEYFDDSNLTPSERYLAVANGIMDAISKLKIPTPNIW